MGASEQLCLTRGVRARSQSLDDNFVGDQRFFPHSPTRPRSVVGGQLAISLAGVRPVPQPYSCSRSELARERFAEADIPSTLQGLRCIELARLE